VFDLVVGAGGKLNGHRERLTIDSRRNEASVEERPKQFDDLVVPAQPISIKVSPLYLYCRDISINTITV